MVFKTTNTTGGLLKANMDISSSSVGPRFNILDHLYSRHFFLNLNLDCRVIRQVVTDSRRVAEINFARLLQIKLLHVWLLLELWFSLVREEPGRACRTCQCQQSRRAMLVPHWLLLQIPSTSPITSQPSSHSCFSQVFDGHWCCSWIAQHHSIQCVHRGPCVQTGIPAVMDCCRDIFLPIELDKKVPYKLNYRNTQFHWNPICVHF